MGSQPCANAPAAVVGGAPGPCWQLPEGELQYCRVGGGGRAGRAGGERQTRVASKTPKMATSKALILAQHAAERCGLTLLFIVVSHRFTAGASEPSVASLQQGGGVAETCDGKCACIQIAERPHSALRVKRRASRDARLAKVQMGPPNKRCRWAARHGRHASGSRDLLHPGPALFLYVGAQAPVAVGLRQGGGQRHLGAAADWVVSDQSALWPSISQVMMSVLAALPIHHHLCSDWLHAHLVNEVGVEGVAVRIECTVALHPQAQGHGAVVTPFAVEALDACGSEPPAGSKGCREERKRLFTQSLADLARAQCQPDTAPSPTPRFIRHPAHQ